jgi:hypothetical protein
MLSRVRQPMLKLVTSNQQDHSNLRITPIDTYWLASTHKPGYPLVYKQGKWHAESYHYPDDGDRINL